MGRVLSLDAGQEEIRSGWLGRSRTYAPSCTLYAPSNRKGANRKWL